MRTKEILSWSRPKLLHWLSEQTTKVAASINYEEPSRIIHKAQVYFSPENHVCCIFSNEFETTFIMEANTMNPDQTAPKGAI